MIANLPSYFRSKVNYDDPLIEQRANGLLVFLGIGIIVTLIASIFLIFSVFSQSADGSFSPSIVQTFGIVSPIFAIAWYWGIRNGFYRVTAVSMVIISILSLLFYWSASLNTVGVLIFILPIIMSGVLLDRSASLLVFFITLGLATGPTLINNNASGDFAIFTVIFSLIAILIVFLSGNIDILANKVIQELSKLQKVVQATVAVSREDDETGVMLNTINIVRDQLGYTFARIYLVEGDEVVQRVQTSLNLSQMNVDTDISFGNRSGIYDAIRTKDIVVIRETDQDVTRQHLLGGTRAALAVPVLDNRNNVIAVIDAQSENLGEFSAPELETIRLVAGQLGQNLQHNRLVNNLRKDLADQDDLIARQRERILQYERTERQSTTESWREYLQERGTDFMGYDMEAGATSPMEAIDLNEDLESAIQTGDIIIQQDGNQQIVSVPISLRGQSLGAMTFRVPTGSQIVGARQQELIRNVVQRLSLALENKRLFEQSQSQAVRERTANEVGNLLLSSTDIDTVLNLAANNFNEALGAIQTQIRLKPDIRTIGESEVKS